MNLESCIVGQNKRVLFFARWPFHLDPAGPTTRVESFCTISSEGLVVVISDQIISICAVSCKATKYVQTFCSKKTKGTSKMSAAKKRKNSKRLSKVPGFVNCGKEEMIIFHRSIHHLQ